ncbi:hypothetical protein [Enterococcus sp. DIV0212c]|uniref:hypothetical protein n=1 Tax=Enterococcus sp. DIV0212c TaxID=2230867 RepID=UPI0035C79D9F
MNGYIDEKGIIIRLEKDSSLVIASGDTGAENKETEVILEHDAQNGILLNLSPDMKKDSYSASLTWSLVNTP